MKDAIKKVFADIKSAVTESSYEVYRKDFEASLGAESAEKKADGTYADPQTEAKWQKLCDSKADAVLQQW